MRTYTEKIGNWDAVVREYHTVIVGAGAAGMCCAKKLYENMRDRGSAGAAERIAVVTAGIGLGASRMSGSDKQTYYKMGTSADIADCADSFASSLTAAGCCHGDLALAEAIGSLRGFYQLVEAGVPFPHDELGSYIGYKTDHDPYERATSAGPKTSQYMSQCLQRYVERYGVAIYDQHEAAELVTVGSGAKKRVAALVTIDRERLGRGERVLGVFLADNFVLAAGGPGELYQTSVYPEGQVGIHGLAFRAGLAGENLTESQFGLASIGFRWNVSGTYMQAIPRVFSTDAEGGNPRDFLTDYFSTLGEMASAIFLKGYQWPFDPQRIENRQSSLIDVLVYNENQQGRRVYLDFLHNPSGGAGSPQFDLKLLSGEALGYLQKAGAVQGTPIERLAHMNAPAIEIYREHGIDLTREPVEIAVCAQHNNGGFAVDVWWQSTVRHTFVIGEMAGTHGVKRPGGSALNSGQVGASRAAEYIAAVYGGDSECGTTFGDIRGQVAAVADRFDRYTHNTQGYEARTVIAEIQKRMTAYGGHIRQVATAKLALGEAVSLYRDICDRGLRVREDDDLGLAVRAEHLSLSSVGYLKAIVSLLEQGSGSRGSHLVLDENGIEIHSDIRDLATGKPLRYKRENESLRKSILRVVFDPSCDDLFSCENVMPRVAMKNITAFESAWRNYREGTIYGS